MVNRPVLTLKPANPAAPVPTPAAYRYARRVRHCTECEWRYHLAHGFHRCPACGATLNYEPAGK